MVGFSVACVINTELYLARLDALTDDDGDGVTEDVGDCNDADPQVFPGAPDAMERIRIATAWRMRIRPT